IYTTPWDNYLVASNIWRYDPNLVTGLTLGWVPIEEYTFFIIQPILAGLWLWFLTRHLPPPAPETPLKTNLRRLLPLLALSIWIAAVILLITSWQPATYLSLELVWALPPIILQLAFGADILWRYRHLVITSFLPLTLYLSTADAIAINAGTWTINPAYSLNILIGGTLPLEEFLFFLLTNLLITFGLVLLWAKESRQRLGQLRRRLISRHPTSPTPQNQPLPDNGH
ncbi:MAG: lycopene cyclase domain-containing protein, partial [Candidatus Promineifilaceae bacterium]